MKIALDTAVHVEYTLKVKDGQTPEDLDRSFNARFIYGRDRVIPALERELLGLEVDDTLELELQPQEAFGEYDPKLVTEIPLSRIKEPGRLERGKVYQETGPDGRPVGFLVKEVGDDKVLADFNHPAAGKVLMLSATVRDVRAATATEILASMNLSSGGG